MKRSNNRRPGRILFLILTVILILAVIIGAKIYTQQPAVREYGFAKELPESEKQLRLKLVTAAEEWLDCGESDGTHQPISDLYNSHEPLAQGYLVQYTDEWCATFVSASAIKAGLTHIIPTECGCQRQIGLLEDLGCWEEADDHIPLPGDIIYYCRTNTGNIGDCTGWADHVGIVVGTSDRWIKVIEGNYGDKVGYRYIKADSTIIRGYGLPNYSLPEA